MLTRSGRCDVARRKGKPREIQNYLTGKTQTELNKRPIESYEHRDKERVNNPPVGLVTPETDPDAGDKKKTYAYDPHLDPQLVWAGKVQMIYIDPPYGSNFQPFIDKRGVKDRRDEDVSLSPRFSGA